MKAFEYAEPRTEAEAVELLGLKTGTSEILAGGTDLVGLMKQMIVTPDRVVNIMEIPSLKEIALDDAGNLVIGAAVSLEKLLDNHYLDPYSSIKQAISNISSMQLRCQGTLGGEICQRPQCWFFRGGHGLLADNGNAALVGDNRYHAIFANAGPAKFVNNSRLAPALIARGAMLRIIGPKEDDEEYLALEDFYRIPRHHDQRENVLADRQLVTHIVLPPSDDKQCATYEVRHGAGPEYPLTSAAVTLQMALGVISEARVVLGHVAPIPWRSLEAEQALLGRRVDRELAERAGQAAVTSAMPLSNNGYKVCLAKVSVERAVLLAAGLPTGGF